MIKKIILSAIRLYKKAISPLINNGYNGCRFHPTCSDYAMQAIEKKGVLRGFLMACWRVLRCNPLSKGGVDEIK